MQNLLGSRGINQNITHFMTEWNGTGGPGDGYLMSYFPNNNYLSSGTTVLNGGQNEPSGTNQKAGDCISIATAVCDGNGATAATNCNAPPVPLSGTSLAQGWPGAQVSPGPFPGPNNTVTMIGASAGLSDPGDINSANKPRGVFQFNYGGGLSPNCVDNALVYYAPPPSMKGGGTGFVDTLADPFIQVGDFYFEGIFGATESWWQGAPRQSYASGAQPDTQVLIRGLAANGTAWDFTQQDPNGAYYGDYWVKNHNSANNGEAGTVVYLEGDSFDGRPDGLRLIWGSILNLGFVPTSTELARSSPASWGSPAAPGPVEHQASNDYLFQGTFVQSTAQQSFTQVFNGKQDFNDWLFPTERGHFYQYNVTVGGASSDACLNSGAAENNNGLSGGAINAAPCVPNPNATNTTVAGACETSVSAGSAGSNTVGFDGPGISIGSPEFWDTSGTDWQTATKSMLINDVPTNIINGRVVFTHLYQPLGAGNAGIGVQPVSLNPQYISSYGAKLGCALFPTSCGVAGASTLACPTGTPATCVSGALACTGCSGTAPVTPPSAVSSSSCNTANACSTNDVGALLWNVYNANGGCYPLLKDTGAPAPCGTPAATQCLDKCWTRVLDRVQPHDAQPAVHLWEPRRQHRNLRSRLRQGLQRRPPLRHHDRRQSGRLPRDVHALPGWRRPLHVGRGRATGAHHSRDPAGRCAQRRPVPTDGRLCRRGRRHAPRDLHRHPQNQRGDWRSVPGLRQLRRRAGDSGPSCRTRTFRCCEATAIARAVCSWTASPPSRTRGSTCEMEMEKSTGPS